MIASLPASSHGYMYCVLSFVSVTIIKMKAIIRGMFLFFLIAGVMSVCRSVKPSGNSLAGLLPDSVMGWSPTEKDHLYDPKTIFDYINGAGEVYRAYDFVILLARRYSRDGQPDILADVFDMGESKNAYGVFTHDLEGEELNIGQASTYKGGFLTFWKGRYYITIFSERETEEAREAVLEIGKQAAAAIPNQGPLPEIVSLMPVENRAEKSLRFLFNHIILNYYFFVADENILFLGSDVPAALADYKLGEDKYRLLLVKYPLSDKAKEAYRSFVGAYMPDARETGLVRTENEKWTFIRTEDNLLLIVFDAPTRSDALAIGESVLLK